MSPENTVRPPELRSKYAFLFNCVAEIHRFRYGERCGTRADDVKAAIERMKKDGFLSEYLSSNLESLMTKYPSLLPGSEQTQEFMRRLKGSLDLVNADLCDEISELSEAVQEFDRTSLESWLNGGKAN